jgi:hypothetical protein
MQHSGGDQESCKPNCDTSTTVSKAEAIVRDYDGPSPLNNVLWQALWLKAVTGTAHVLLQGCNNPSAAHSDSTVPQITHKKMPRAATQ